MFRDNAHGRVFQTELPDNSALTVESCIASCSSQGFTLAGLEYSVQCCMFDRRRRSIDQPAGIIANFASQSVVTISYKVPLQPLTATAICPVVEMPRKCLLPSPHVLRS